LAAAGKEKMAAANSNFLLIGISLCWKAQAIEE
jgi:hypothetical protein